VILEVTIGESICIRMDDEMTDSRPVPEAVGDYLARMREQAVKCYVDLPSAAEMAANDET
jgi:hypothetical protein